MLVFNVSEEAVEHGVREKFWEMKLYSKTNLLRTQDQKIQSYF